MLEFSKRWGPVFFGGFVASVVGIVPALIYVENPIPIVAILGTLALICLVGTIIALSYDLKDARRRDKPPAPRIHWLE